MEMMLYFFVKRRLAETYACEVRHLRPRRATFLSHRGIPGPDVYSRLYYGLVLGVVRSEFHRDCSKSKE